MFLKLVNRASTLGIAGFDLLGAAMPLGCLRNRASTWGLVGFDLLFAEMPLDISRTFCAGTCEIEVYMRNGWF